MWKTVSNAFASSSSSRIRWKSLLWFRPLLICFCPMYRAVVVLCTFLKSCCCDFNVILLAIDGWMGHSISLASGDNREISRNEFESSSGFPGFSIGITLAVFQILEIQLVL